MSDNPLEALLEIRARRQAAGTPPLGRTLVGGAGLLLLSLPGLGVGLQALFRGWDTARAWDTALGLLPGTWVITLAALTFVLLLVVPSKHVSQNVGVLAGLRAGRGLIELLGTRTRPGEILDGIARQTTFAVLREVTPWLLPLALAWLVFPGHSPALVMGLLLVAGPVLGLLTWASCYLALAWELWVSTQDPSPVSQVLAVALFAALLPLGLCLLLGFVGALGLGEPLLGFSWLLVWLVIYLGLNLLVSRNLALVGLERLPQVRERLEQAGRRLLRRHRNRWMRVGSDNPIVAREACREAARTPWGPLGWFFLRVPALWLIPGVGWSLLADGAPPLGVWLGSVCVLAVGQAALASSRTVLAVVGEVEQATLEVLQASRISAAEFCDGWAQVGYGRRLLELGLLAPLGLAMIEYGHLSWSLAWCLPWLAAGVVFAAWAGLWASLGRTRRLAQERLAAALTLSLLLQSLLGIWGVVQWGGPLALQVSTLTLALGAWLLRRGCLRALAPG